VIIVPAIVMVLADWLFFKKNKQRA
jgi:hypothetical protein